MIKIRSVLVIPTIVMTLVAASAPVHAKGFLDTILGKNDESEQKAPPPEVTLQAPFATKTDTKAPQSKLMDMYGSADKIDDTNNDLSLPHRNEKQIVDWTTEIVSQAMTMDLKTYNNDFKKISYAFTPYALKEYQDYLQKTNMVNVLSSNEMRLQAVSNEEGAVIKNGQIDGTYHWLVQVPLMTSFYKEDMDTVDKSTNAQNQRLLVQVQVGRVAAKKDGDIGLVIERWTVSSNSNK